MKTVYNPSYSGTEPAGFTLMEVLVSITVIAIVLASLFRMQSS